MQSIQVKSALAALAIAACAGDPDERAYEQDVINGTPVSPDGSGWIRFQTELLIGAELKTETCSGMLRNNEWVQTAAHCTLIEATQVTMGSQASGIAEVIRHPSLDLAMVRLTTPMAMAGSTTGFRRLVRRDVIVEGNPVDCFGYGIISLDGMGVGTLRRATLTIADNDNGEYRFLPNGSDQIQAPGDSGGSCLDEDGNSILVFNAGNVGPTGINYTVGVRGDRFVDWSDNIMAGYGLSFGTIAEPYFELDFGAPSPWQPIAGDFNGDGRDDHLRLGGTGAWLFYGNTAGKFSRGFQSYVEPEDGFPLDFGIPSPWAPIAGDFNGDGRDDYARLGGTGAWVFYGNADETFTRAFQSYVDPSDGVPLNFFLPSTWQNITGDFNADGRSDYARLGGTGAWVFYGQPNAAPKRFLRVFQSYVDPADGTPLPSFGEDSPWQVVTGDFNGDGRTDYARLGDDRAVFFTARSSSLSFDRNTRSYVVDPEGNSLHFGLPSQAKVVGGDFDGDGRGDYARLLDAGAWVFYSNGNLTSTIKFQNYGGLDFGFPSPWDPITGDFNNDGRDDYAWLGDTGAWLSFGIPGRTWELKFDTYLGLDFGLPSPQQVVTGDVNGDGRGDYVRLGAQRALLFVAR